MATQIIDAPQLRLGGRRYPAVLPKLRDSRMHVAAVTITLHVLGQTVLGFRVSVPQILVAILAPAAVELVRIFRRTGSIVWPASAMLTIYRKRGER